ncbi:uncharacterized protein EI97DRAFT_429290 [Westerdykella ornata]|uniref:Heterokaryon incompatibility domain-containing protein n=1 Tax=Westerdykella ornata TaxID=318751 RepID=A0A6A6JYS3_WESOR|nr:uncharacterized protein EI97DRAFT_429290 [Westerdykella ornata]KAF2281243.1 hypothetical protein EI97DRAFT_429290 [Westerdykella ornata]
MSNSSVALPSATPTQDAAWSSLVTRSIAAWDDITSKFDRPPVPELHKGLLRQYDSLDDFLASSPDHLTYWFFQRRSAFLSQTRFRKWSRDALDDYILLPAAPGYVWRADCFFVSHFWRTTQDPDPDGETLRLHQAELTPQTWSYIWVDWTCLPQHPRSPPEKNYFHRGLRTMSGIIRNTGFIYFYPPFTPRLWILYEVAEYVLTSVGGLAETHDIEPFLSHVDEMVENGVRATLIKHDYHCREERDRRYLTSWLELLVLLRRLEIEVDLVRRVMDHMTWFNVSGSQVYPGMEVNRYEGILVYRGDRHGFTPFPKWVRCL